MQYLTLYKYTPDMGLFSTKRVFSTGPARWFESCYYVQKGLCQGVRLVILQPVIIRFDCLIILTILCILAPNKG